MDKGKAIDRFLRRVDQFYQIALITSEEVEGLFGEEVTQALAQLEHFLTENRICAKCGGVCCKEIGCELYAPLFGRCPIHEYRPIACRMHFCHRLDGPYRPLIIELRDVFAGCYRAVDFSDSANLRSLDSPPFVGVCPQFVTAVGSCINAVREGSLSPGQALQTLHREVVKCRQHTANRRHTIDSPGASSELKGHDPNPHPRFSS